MKIKLILILLIFNIHSSFANTETTQSTQITSSINVGQNVDYILTRSTSIFSSQGSLNIPSTSMEHSVIIFKSVKPSVVISNWLSYVKINGSAASNGVNCQVRMYNKGAIILPYASNFSPLTCYTGTNYSGTACSDYSVGHSGGYMKTLTEANLLNNFKSFKLKRGYMVTFATGTAGWGYSRCFIAATEDLEMNLPAVLAGKVSSYRLFQWYNFGKSGIANDTRKAVCDALNVQSAYGYGTGEDLRPDVECIPHKIHKNWPGVAECGSCDFSAHMKTDNEPANSSDDTPATVDEVLGYWQDAMRTGMRLCAPSSHDGGYGWQEEFMNAIDARGWRCDILDLHCYWVTSSFTSLVNYYNKYQRPIWVTEWLWGASWGNSGMFSGNPSAQTINSETSTILGYMNSYDYVERYHYWNSESRGHIYEDGTGVTSPLGQTYATTDGGLGYKAAIEFVPIAIMRRPYSLSGETSGSTISLAWKDINGDMMDEIRVQYKTANATSWTTLATVSRKDKTGSGNQSYTYSGTLANASNYWWRVVDMYEGTEYCSDILKFSEPVLVNNSKEIPANLGDYYFQFYSKEANSDLVWAVYESGDENRVYYKAANSNYANDLYQLWSLEGNSTGGYSLRNVGESAYFIASPSSWNFITRNTTSEGYNTAFDFTYNSLGDYWICKNLAHPGNYVGLWDNDKNFSTGEVLAANRDSETTADHIGIRLIPRSVVNEAIGIVTIPAGNYYLYNNESGLFLAAGNNWDTRAIVAETGIDFALTSNSNGFLLDSNIDNGGSNHYLGDNLYCDSSPFVWTFAKSEVIDGKQSYTIANGSNYLSAPTTANTAVNTTTNANAASAKWLLLTRNDLLARLDGASQNNPADATFLLPCAGFGRNDKRIERWNGIPARGGYAGGEWGNQNAEKFNTPFDVYQLVTDAPDGLYEVTCQAFYRYGGHGISPAATAKANGTEALNAKFYANDVVADVLSIFADAGNCGTVGVESDYGYAPNTMDDASNYFQAGLYQNGPLRFVVEGGSLRVGIKKDVAVTNDWTIFDNFRLSYLGPDYIIGDVNNDKQITIADVTALVNIILGKDSVEPYLYNHKAADVNTDKGISIADVTALVNIILGKIGS